MNLFTLDDVINATMGRATVVSENHDEGSINWVNGMSDPGEMIACGYLPDIRRMDGEADEAYAARIRPIIAQLPEEQRTKIEETGRNSAIRRAAYDTTGGRVRAMFAGKPAWSGLGVNVDRACSSAQAIEFAGLNWRVEKVPMGFTWEGQYTKTTDTFAIVRADNGAHLGTVGGRYAPIQNSDGFGYLDNVLSSVGAKYETAGSLYGGSKVWMLAHLPEQRFSIGREDACEPYVVFMNTHDGSGAAACYPTAVRVECNNTLRISAKDKAKGISIRHTGSVKDKVKAAQKALGLAVQGFTEFKESAEAMARTPCEPLPYFDGILDSVLDITKAEMSKGADALAAAIAVTHAERQAARKLAEHKIKTRREIFDDMVTRYESERCANGRGTLWSAFNAVTESADHGLAGGRLRGDDKQSRRFESVIAGRADEIKQVAYAQAMGRA